jgi:hypothetical protein
MGQAIGDFKNSFLIYFNYDTCLAAAHRMILRPIMLSHMALYIVSVRSGRNEAATDS